MTDPAPEAGDYVPGGERRARPGEFCKCGRPAVIVYETAKFGDVPYCGIPDGGADRAEVAPTSSSGPRKAFLVSYTVTNEMDGVIYADSATDARRRFREGDYDHAEFEANGNDGRTGGVRVRRMKEADR